MSKLVRYEKHLKPCARSLRRSMTDCEVKLWGRLRGKQLRGLQFYRQKPIANFIVDFYCPAAKLVIEVDGGQHFTKDGLKRDRARDQSLEAAGLRVVRVSDLDVIRKMEAVLEMIHGVLQEQISPNPSLRKKGAGEEFIRIAS